MAKGQTFIQRSRDKRPSEKASYHEVEGAGRRHVKREFFGLNDSDERAIADKVGLALELTIQRTA